MERYIGWIIDEHDVTKGTFRSDAVVDLEADVYPDLEHLYKFLKDNNIVTSNYEHLIDLIRNTIYGLSICPSSTEKEDLTILNAIAEYVNKNKYHRKESARAILSIVQTGNSRTYKRAMDKIKIWVRDSLPNPRLRAIQFLKEKRLISQNVNPYCEVLSKDI